MRKMKGQLPLRGLQVKGDPSKEVGFSSGKEEKAVMLVKKG
jgi:hypothetical protein